MNTYQEDIENLRALVVAMRASGESRYSESILRLVGEVERLKQKYEPVVPGNIMLS